MDKDSAVQNYHLIPVVTCSKVLTVASRSSTSDEEKTNSILLLIFERPHNHELTDSSGRITIPNNSQHQDMEAVLKPSLIAHQSMGKICDHLHRLRCQKTHCSGNMKRRVGCSSPSQQESHTSPSLQQEQEKGCTLADPGHKLNEIGKVVFVLPVR